MKLYSTIFFISCIAFCLLIYDINCSKRKNVLIIGSSYPAIQAAAVLTLYNHTVTIVHEGTEFNNEYMPVNIKFGGKTYRLPKIYQTIFERSYYTKIVMEKMNIKLHTEKELNILLQNNKFLTLSENQHSVELMWKAYKSGCVKSIHPIDYMRLLHLMKDFNLKEYRKKYSGISFLDLAKQLKMPLDIISCIFNSIVLNSGMNTTQINAAEALSRAEYYYFNGTNGLKTYHMMENYMSSNATLFMDIYKKYFQMANVKIIPNRKITTLNVEPTTGKVLGDFHNRSETYDYVILSENLVNSLSLLRNTRDINTGAPKIYNPLNKLISIMESYKPNKNLMTWKIFINSTVKWNQPAFFVINNSPQPYSLQSIKNINKLAGLANKPTILEILINRENNTVFPKKKLEKEIYSILPELKGIPLNGHYEILDNGALMDTNFGKNPIEFITPVMLGMPNFVLSADWVDLSYYPNWDMERQLVIGGAAGYFIQFYTN